jgi:hypothetical protein
MTKRNFDKSLEKQLKSLQNEDNKRKKLNGPRTSLLTGFVKLDDNVEVQLIKSELKTEFFFPTRNPSLLDLILYYFDDDFLDLMIKENVEISAKFLPNIFSNPKSNTLRRNLDVERRNLVLRYIATRYYIMSDPALLLKNNWPLSTDSKLFLGRDVFQKMISNMLIRLNMTTDVNNRLSKYVRSGRYVSIDEKHKGCQKDNYLSRWVYGKEPNWGHWITELTTVAPTTGMPLLMRLMPLTSTKPENLTIEPYNNFNLLDVHQELSKVIRKGTMIVEDAYYLDDNSRTSLRKKKIPYQQLIQ